MKGYYLPEFISTVEKIVDEVINIDSKEKYIKFIVRLLADDNMRIKNFKLLLNEFTEIINDYHRDMSITEPFRDMDRIVDLSIAFEEKFTYDK